MSVGDFWFPGQLMELKCRWTHRELPSLQIESILWVSEPEQHYNLWYRRLDKMHQFSVAVLKVLISISFHGVSLKSSNNYTGSVEVKCNHFSHRWFIYTSINHTTTSVYLISRRLVMDREQCSDDDVTRHVCYNSPFIGLSRVSLIGTQPNGQN